MTTAQDQPRTVRVDQGSQPHFRDVAVGIVLVGPTREGPRKARLLVRSPTERTRVDVAQGGSIDLFGRGTLTVDAVHLAGDGPDGGREGVTLTFAVPGA